VVGQGEGALAGKSTLSLTLPTTRIGDKHRAH
jgi:hypothetical protein